MSTSSAVVDEWRGPLRAAGLADPEGLLSDVLATDRLAGRWLALPKPGLDGRERWRWELNAGANGGAAVVYVKRYRRPRLAAQIDRIGRQSARHSRAWWEYQRAWELRQAHVAAPRPVAFVERMAGGVLERCSALLLEAVAGEAFDRTWRRLCASGAAVTRGPLRHEVARRLGRFAAAFHSTGLCHRDLYLCHVFVEIDAEGREGGRFALIDLARTHRPRLRRMRWLLKDLSQLDASARQIGATRTDRWRCLLAYLALQPGSPRTRWYARRIVRRSDRILARAARGSAAP